MLADDANRRPNEKDPLLSFFLIPSVSSLASTWREQLKTRRHITLEGVYCSSSNRVFARKTSLSFVDHRVFRPMQLHVFRRLRRDRGKKGALFGRVHREPACRDAVIGSIRLPPPSPTQLTDPERRTVPATRASLRSRRRDPKVPGIENGCARSQAIAGRTRNLDTTGS